MLTQNRKCQRRTHRQGNRTLDLRIIENDVKVRFPWFSKTEDSMEINHYIQFIEALCNMAIQRNRVTSTAKKSENEKYGFRCFLSRLGFI